MNLKKSILYSTAMMLSLASQNALAYTPNYSDQSVSQVVSFASDLANRGVGVDIDGLYGMQCVDLVNWISSKYFGKPLRGNAIDLLNSAKSQGLTVIYASSGQTPKAGDIYVSDTTRLYGHPYGHTGLVIQDAIGQSFRTVEQNVDGNANALSVGGPARFLTRNINQHAIIGWIRLPYKSLAGTAVSSSVPVASSSSTSSVSTVPQQGKFTVGVAKLNVRDKPSLSGNILATYTAGMSLNFNGIVEADGYRWASYISYSGAKRYVAIGQISGDKLISYGQIN